MNTASRTTFRTFKNQTIAILTIAMLALAALQASPAHAAGTITSTPTGGDWNSTSTWVGGIVPGAADSVTIASGATVTVTANASAALMTFLNNADSSSTVAVNPGVTLAISGAVIIRRGLTTATNTLSVGAGNLTAGGISFTSPLGTETGGHAVTISTGSVIVSGNIIGDSAASATITFSDAGVLKVSGSMYTSGTGSLHTFAGSTVEYNGAGTQTVGNFAYSNLTLSGSGAKNLPLTATIGGNLTLAGTASSTASGSKTIGGNLAIGAGTEFDLPSSNTATFAVTGSTTVSGTLMLYNTAGKTFTGNVTINNGGTWNELGAAAISFGGSLQNNGTFTANTGQHNFNGIGASIGGTHAIAIPNLHVGGTATNNGTLTVSTALFGAGTLTNGATGVLNFGGSAVSAGLNATPSGNIVNYNGADQTVKATGYDGLTLSGSGVKSIGAGSSIAAHLVMASGTSASITAGQLIPVGTLTLGGVNEPIGTWGGAGSGAANTNTTYFAATTGQLDVGKAILTIAAKSFKKTYGSTYTFAGTEFTTSGLASGDSVTSVTLTSTGAPAGALVSGSPYAITITPGSEVGTGLSKYYIVYADGFMNVVGRPLTITAQNQSKTYGDGSFSFAGTEFTVGANQLVNGDSVSSVTLNSAATDGSAGAGQYPITPSAAVGSGLDNYAISYVNGTFTVNPLDIHVTADAQSKTYGDPDPTFTYTHDPLLNSDSFTGSLGRASGQNVGVYAINIGTLSAGSNYHLLLTSANLTITKKALTQGTVDNKTIAAGAPDPKFTVTYAGLVAGDSFASIDTPPTCGVAVAHSSPGNYTIHCDAGTGFDNNYDLSGVTYTDGTLHVTLAVFSSSPSSWGFGVAKVGSVSPVKTFYIKNTGTSSLSIGAVHLGGLNPGQFSITANGCANKTLAASATCAVSVVFKPTSTGVKSAGILFADDAPGNPHFISISGKGGVELSLNGGFNNYPTSTVVIPNNWVATHFAPGDGKNTLVHEEGTASVKISNTTAVNKTLTQTRSISGAAGSPLLLSAWVKGQNVPTTAGVVAVQVQLYNGTTLVQTKYIFFPSTTYAFTQRSLAFNAAGAYNKVVIRLIYSKGSGSVWFDGLSLVG